jgi:hypothetical protein
MASSADFRELARTVELLSTPLLIRVLHGLGHGYAIGEAVPDGSDAAAIQTAVRRLADVGAVQYGLDGSAPPHPEHAIITAKGRRILRVLETPVEQFADQG